MNRKLKIALVLTGVIIAPVLISPLPGFDSPTSTVVEASDGSLLGARIADDGQWRFPAIEEIPEKFEKALITFEDRWYYYHPGINPVAVFRALLNNLEAGRIVSGGSTISMQVSRMARGNTERTYGGKISEMLSALKLELFYSKRSILKLYTANAPFGGNTVGLEAASWRYTGKPSSELTWAEAAAMAVLPNSPSLVFPGRNKEILKARRDRLLQKLYERKYIDSLTLLLALEEPIPSEPGLLPAKAQHLTDHFFLEKKGERVKTTIDPNLQELANAVMNRHQKDLSSNFIFNSACIIVRVETGEVMAYIGNSNLENSSLHGGDVDIIKSLRSTGSILKPLLYTGMLNSGDILPNTLIADVPTRFPGFSPKNFDHSYSGAVPAGAALSQSLNIPAVKMLQKFSPEKFLDLLRLTGFTTFKKNSDYYGLSLILGGGETSLWELTGMYASMSRVLKRYNKEKKYSPDDYHPPVLLQDHKPALKNASADVPPLSASSIWLTYEALRKVNRPESESGWQYFNSSLNLAWKTGTSFGFRDAWAVGTTSEFVIGVWAGNCDGEGRPGLTGITAAAPVLFELAGLVDQSSWFDMPLEDLTMIKVCTKSGFRTGPDCPESIEIPACVNGLRSEACPWHTIIHLNKSGTMQVNTDCASPSEIIKCTMVHSPSGHGIFLQDQARGIQAITAHSPGLRRNEKIPVMEFIYPTAGIKIFIPRDQTGELTNVISEIAHRDPGKKIFWHLDEIYLGTTDFLHQMDIQANPGKHILTTVDEDGNTLSCFFYIAEPPG